MKTRKVEQGKGTADHLMPLGYLFLTVLSFHSFPTSSSSPGFPRCLWLTLSNIVLLLGRCTIEAVECGVAIMADITVAILAGVIMGTDITVAIMAGVTMAVDTMEATIEIIINQGKGESKSAKTNHRVSFLPAIGVTFPYTRDFALSF